STRVLAPFGRLLVLGFTAGEIPAIKVNRLLLKNISVEGVAWGAATLADPTLIAGQWEALREHVTAGRLSPRIHARYPLAEAASAIRELDDRSVIPVRSHRLRWRLAMSRPMSSFMISFAPPKIAWMRLSL